MDERQKIAVTAIRDVAQEGFIASTLVRLGWQVLYRATSIDGLLSLIDQRSDLVIVASDDFRGVERVQQASLIKLRGTASHVTSESDLNPRNENELQLIMQGHFQEMKSPGARMQLFSGEVLALGSIGRSVGTSTVALNFAQEIYLQRESTLLVDANFSHPTFSQYFDLHGISRTTKESQCGFSISEIVQIDDVHRINNSAEEFRRLVVDLGQLRITERTAVGRRLEDVATSWALHSMSSLHIVTRNSVEDFKKFHSMVVEISRISPLPAIHHLIILDEVLGRRERERVAVTARETTGVAASIISRDRKSVQGAAIQRSTLAASAPKSLIRNEILIHLNDCDRRGNIRSL